MEEMHTMHLIKKKSHVWEFPLQNKSKEYAEVFNTASD